MYGVRFLEPRARRSTVGLKNNTLGVSRQRTTDPDYHLCSREPVSVYETQMASYMHYSESQSYTRVIGAFPVTTD